MHVFVSSAAGMRQWPLLNVSMLFGNQVWDKFITYVSKWISLIILPQIEPTSAVLEKGVMSS
jgi:hypothetical protein